MFKSLGYVAYDYDIENNFGQTDYVIDLFNEIENAFNHKKSIFDDFNSDDLIFAFFPCTYFSVQNDLIYSRTCHNFKTWEKEKVDEYINERKESRDLFFKIFTHFVSIVKEKKFKTIIENPFNGNYLLTKKEFSNPSIVIKNRRDYGDYYKKPTMFYFFNLEPTYFSTSTINTYKKQLKVKEQHGITRSLISKEFAINFINKYIFGLK